METVTSIDALCAELRKRTASNATFITGLDGIDSVGKTTLGRELAGHLNAFTKVIEGFACAPSDGFRRFIPAQSWVSTRYTGNVWDWVQDCYHDSYAGAPTDGPALTRLDLHSLIAVAVPERGCQFDNGYAEHQCDSHGRELP
jgi:hypothetical protein